MNLLRQLVSRACGESRLKKFLGAITPEAIPANYCTANAEEIRLPSAISTAALFFTNNMTVGLATIYGSMARGLPGLLSRFKRFPFDAVAFEHAAYCHALLKHKTPEPKGIIGERLIPL